MKNQQLGKPTRIPNREFCPISPSQITNLTDRRSVSRKNRRYCDRNKMPLPQLPTTPPLKPTPTREMKSLRRQRRLLADTGRFSLRENLPLKGHNFFSVPTGEQMQPSFFHKNQHMPRAASAKKVFSFLLTVNSES